MERRLTEDERRAISGLYDERYARKGRGHETVGWGSERDQRLRFSMLLHGIDPRGRAMLDVGCGLGDLVPFLDERTGGDYDYLGTDLSEKLIEDARRTFAHPRRQFRTADILETDLPQADIVVLSGALNFRIGDNMAHAKTMLSRMWGLARDSVCVNFLSSHVDFQAPKNFHYDPAEMFTFAKTLTRWVSLHHDYPLWEFTLQLRRHPQEGL